MLLEAAMAELHDSSTAASATSSSPENSKLADTDFVVDEGYTRDAHGISTDAGHTDDSDGVSLLCLHGAPNFASRVLHRGSSNLAESSRFGSYRSTTVAAGNVPFQWEAQPGKAKNPIAMADADDDHPHHLPPLTHPPNYLSSHYHSPASSSPASPRSLTGKVKSLIINHVKKPSLEHFNFVNGTSEAANYLHSPSRPSSQRRARRERKLFSLSNGSGHSSTISSTCNSSTPICRHGNNTKTEEYGPRSSLNHSDTSSSPYYFSPLSTSSYQMSHGVLSPRPSVEQSSSASNSNTCSHTSVSSHMSSRGSSGGSNSSSSSIASTVTPSPSRLASLLLSITSMTNDDETNGDSSMHGSNGVLSFTSPEMEVLDDQGLLSTGHNNKQGTKATMEDFISRGGPHMNGSLLTSRLTFPDDFGRKLSQKSRYYSSQLSLKGTREPMNHHVSRNLDDLFPLKPPVNVSKIGLDMASKSNSQSAMASSYKSQPAMASNCNIPSANDSPSDDRQSNFADALDSSLDSSILSAGTDHDGEMKSMIESIFMNPHGAVMGRPAQEVVMEASDENEFVAFDSPVASAFVFSSRKGSSHNTTTDKQWKLSMSNTPKQVDPPVEAAVYAQAPSPKSILKKPSSQELTKVVGGDGEPRSNVLQQKRLNHSGSQKISSVLLRFAEVEEQLLKSSNHHHHHHHQGGMRSPACMKPMCYALGRAFLCKSAKLS